MPSDMQGFPGQANLHPYLTVSEQGALQSAGAHPAAYAPLAVESYFSGNQEGKPRGIGAVDLCFMRGNADWVASANGAALIGGLSNLAAGRNSFVGGGATNFINSGGNYSAAFGRLNTINGSSTLVAGQRNTVNGAFAIALGQRLLGAKQGQLVIGAANIASTAGAAQHSLYQMANVTTDATTTKLWLDGDGATAALTLATNQVMAFHVLVAAMTSAGGDSAMFELKGGIANAGGTVALVGVPTSVLIGNTAGAALWTAVAAADNTAKALLINVTGAIATTIRWVAAVQCAEVVF